MLGWLRDPPAQMRASGETARSAAPEEKASRVGAIVALHSAGRPVWTPRTYAALARAGYMKNPVVYRAVRMVSEAAASIPWLLYDRAAELDDHPLLALLKKPNAHQAGADFFEALYGHLLVSGNAYAEMAIAAAPRLPSVQCRPRPVRATQWRMRALHEPRRIAGLLPLAPFIKRVAANAMAPAQFRHTPVPALTQKAS